AGAPSAEVNPPAASSFSFEPVFVVLAVAAAIAYARALRGRLRSWRTAVFGLGPVLVVVPLNPPPGAGPAPSLVAVPLTSPPETVAAHYLLLAHLLQNAVIADWAPPLLILGLTPAM